MEIRNIILDYDKGILEINGKRIETPVIVKLPPEDGWARSKLFNSEKVKKGERHPVLTISFDNQQKEV